MHAPEGSGPLPLLRERTRERRYGGGDRATEELRDGPHARPTTSIRQHVFVDEQIGQHQQPSDGACNPGSTTPALWTEEYQAEIYRHQIAMLNKIPQLRGTSPWLLMDFRSARRVNPGLQDNFNRKGLISDQGVKKQAFFILQKAYKEKSLGKPE